MGASNKLTPVREWLTRAEVEILIADKIKPYHEQNTVKFERLFSALDELNGSIKTAIGSSKIAAWGIGLLVVIVGIIVAAVKR